MHKHRRARSASVVRCPRTRLVVACHACPARTSCWPTGLERMIAEPARISCRVWATAFDASLFA